MDRNWAYEKELSRSRKKLLPGAELVDIRAIARNLREYSWNHERRMQYRTSKRGERDEHEIEIDSVLYKDGTYKMWYTGKSENSHKIGYATSKDGIKWQKHKDNPVYDDKTVVFEMNPTVVHDPGAKEHKMYYTAATRESEYSPVRLATSKDGISWKRYSYVPVLDVNDNNWERMKLFVTFVRIDKIEQKTNPRENIQPENEGRK